MTRPVFDFKDAIEKAAATFEKAANSKDTATIANLYAEDATLLPPGSPPIKGLQNIRGFWQAFIDAGASNASLQTVSVESSGDLAYEIGAYEADVPNPQGGGTVRSSGKYLVAWKRQSDGSVKMVADMFSPNA